MNYHEWFCVMRDDEEESSMRRFRYITVTSYRARWHLKSPAPRLFTQPFFFGRWSKKTSKLRVTGLCERKPQVTDFPHKGPVTRKMLPFDDVIMARWRWEGDDGNKLSRVPWMIKNDEEESSMWHFRWMQIWLNNTTQESRVNIPEWRCCILVNADIMYGCWPYCGWRWDLSH